MMVIDNPDDYPGVGAEKISTQGTQWVDHWDYLMLKVGKQFDFTFKIVDMLFKWCQVKVTHANTNVYAQPFGGPGGATVTRGPLPSLPPAPGTAISLGGVRPPGGAAPPGGVEPSGSTLARVGSFAPELPPRPQRKIRGCLTVGNRRRPHKLGQVVNSQDIKS